MHTISTSDEEDAFRDHFSAVDAYGKRIWFYPRKPSGKWHNRRALFAAVLLLILFGLPFVRMNGQPLFLFNVLERKFILFGVFIGPQDYWIFGLLMLSFLVFVTLFTNLWGRLWCGWACPQTVFMEMVFRKIEYWIEGDWNRQRALDKAVWNTAKVTRKMLKWAIFLVLSFMIANLLLAYVLGTREVAKLVTEPVAGNIGLFTGVCVFTLVFFFNFAWLRDQACTVVCPYGRLQGVLLDKDSSVVAYDHARGEPRDKLRKNRERTGGDCISCMQCVHVCPTGIDIRNGTQMECINCTACMDACDQIMDQIGFERGLIRYTSEAAIEGKKGKKSRGRFVGYLVLLLASGCGLGYALAMRTDTETVFLRVPGSRYIENPDGTVSNLYNFSLYNKTNRRLSPVIRLETVQGKLVFAGLPHLALEPAGRVQGTVVVTIPVEALRSRKTIVGFGVYAEGRQSEHFETTFIAPDRL